jgi:hypothetical protein
MRNLLFRSAVFATSLLVVVVKGYPRTDVEEVRDAEWPLSSRHREEDSTRVKATTTTTTTALVPLVPMIATDELCY